VLLLRGIQAKVVSADTVTGPYDVIALLDADDINRLGTFVTDSIQRVEGVSRTITCLSTKLR